MTVRLCADGVRRVTYPAVPASDSSVLTERMGNHRKPAHLRPKRTSKPRNHRR